ncbi:MAG: hypothetical protein NT034_00840, partial [Candidatus Magasanikbacteria bacterium]|nr:hypothetical protein [Candidatus Magasanikbacteria bacterium]
QEVRRQLDEAKEPTIQDLLTALKVERVELDRVADQARQLEEGQNKRNKHFVQDVGEAFKQFFGYEGRTMLEFRSDIKRLKWFVGAALFIGVVTFAIHLSSSSAVSSAVKDAQAANKTASKTQMGFAAFAKAQNTRNTQFQEKLDTKAVTVEVNKQFQDSEVKAKKYVAAELDKFYQEKVDARVQEILAAANAQKSQVDGLSTKVGSVSRKLNSVDRRVQEILKDNQAKKGQPATM